MSFVFYITAALFLLFFMRWNDDTFFNQRLRVIMFLVASLNGVAGAQLTREAGNTTFSAVVAAMTALACLRLFTFWTTKDTFNKVIRWTFLVATVAQGFCAFRLFGLL